MDTEGFEARVEAVIEKKTRNKELVVVEVQSEVQDRLLKTFKLWMSIVGVCLGILGLSAALWGFQKIGHINEAITEVEKDVQAKMATIEEKKRDVELYAGQARRHAEEARRIQEEAITEALGDLMKAREASLEAHGDFVKEAGALSRQWSYAWAQAKTAEKDVAELMADIAADTEMIRGLGDLQGRMTTLHGNVSEDLKKLNVLATEARARFPVHILFSGETEPEEIWTRLMEEGFNVPWDKMEPYEVGQNRITYYHPCAKKTADSIHSFLETFAKFEQPEYVKGLGENQQVIQVQLADRRHGEPLG